MIRKHIPNMMTLGNLLCGCLAVFCLMKEELNLAGLFVLVALFLDFFDGFTARLLGVSSPIGKDLDSLADMVTFGVVPGFFMFWMMLQSLGLGLRETDFTALTRNSSDLTSFCAFLITLFSCLRLAKFNNDTRQTQGFIGMPTPANTMLVASLALLHQSDPSYLAGLFHPAYLLLLTGLLSYLLVSEVPMLALKFKTFGWKGNEFRYLLLGGSVLLLVVLQLRAVPLVMLLYILLSIVNNIFSKKAA